MLAFFNRAKATAATLVFFADRVSTECANLNYLRPCIRPFPLYNFLNRVTSDFNLLELKVKVRGQGQT